MATAQISVAARVTAGIDHLDRTLGAGWPHRVDVDELPYSDVISQLHGDFFGWRSREGWSTESVLAAGFDAPTLAEVPELTAEWTRRINALQALGHTDLPHGDA